MTAKILIAAVVFLVVWKFASSHAKAAEPKVAMTDQANKNDAITAAGGNAYAGRTYQSELAPKTQGLTLSSRFPKKLFPATGFFAECENC